MHGTPVIAGQQGSCPTCGQVLVLPPGHEQVRCVRCGATYWTAQLVPAANPAQGSCLACGQVLTLPASLQEQVRCPRCANVYIAAQLVPRAAPLPAVAVARPDAPKRDKSADMFVYLMVAGVIVALPVILLLVYGGMLLFEHGKDEQLRQDRQEVEEFFR